MINLEKISKYGRKTQLIVENIIDEYLVPRFTQVLPQRGKDPNDGSKMTILNLNV